MHALTWTLTIVRRYKWGTEKQRERERYAASLLTSSHPRSYRAGWNLPSVFIINLWKKCGFVVDWNGNLKQDAACYYFYWKLDFWKFYFSYIILLAEYFLTALLNMCLNIVFTLLSFRRWVIFNKLIEFCCAR